jgi:hypothetical protein
VIAAGGVCSTARWAAFHQRNHMFLAPLRRVLWYPLLQRSDFHYQVQIWIMGATSSKPTFKGLLPTWQMVIDGEAMARGLFSSFEVPGRTIALQYQMYRFTCRFPGTPIGILKDTIGPLPE